VKIIGHRIKHICIIVRTEFSIVLSHGHRELTENSGPCWREILYLKGCFQGVLKWLSDLASSLLFPPLGHGSQYNLRYRVCTPISSVTSPKLRILSYFSYTYTRAILLSTMSLRSHTVWRRRWDDRTVVRPLAHSIRVYRVEASQFHGNSWALG
jgi:hypothetical protein